MVGVFLGSDHRHAQRCASHGGAASDPPQAKDAERLTAKGGKNLAWPGSVANLLVVVDEGFGDGEHQSDGQLGHCRMICVGGNGECHPAVRRRLHVNTIVSDARPCDDLQAGTPVQDLLVVVFCTS